MLPGLVGTGFFVGTAAGGAGWGNHRYWRIYVTDNNGGSNVSIFEAEFRGSAGGSDLTGSGTAYDGGTGTTTTDVAANAFDNNSTGTAWTRTGTTGACYLAYDFGVGTTVAEFAITSGAAGGGVDNAPKTFQIEWSDDNSSWTLADGPYIVTSWLVNQQRAFPETPAAGTHRYWRLFVTSTTGGTQTQIVEMEFRATSGGADQTSVQTSNTGSSTGRIVFSGEGIGNEAYRAYDGTLTTTTGWFVSSGANTYNGYVFPSPVAVQEVTVLGSATTTRSPSALKIQSSDDGVTWTDRRTATGLTWTAGETKTFSVP